MSKVQSSKYLSKDLIFRATEILRFSFQVQLSIRSVDQITVPKRRNQILRLTVDPNFYRDLNRLYLRSRNIWVGLIDDRKNMFKLILFCVGLIFSYGAVYAAGQELSYEALELQINRGPSMFPLFSDGDAIMVDHTAYLKSKPKRGDVIVFEHPKKGGYLIKRIIGIPEDQVEYGRSGILVNGKKLIWKKTEISFEPKKAGVKLEAFKKENLDSYLETNGTTQYQVLFTRGLPQEDHLKVKVPRENYFVLGDNRDFSNDSRIFGTLPAEKINGKVLVIPNPKLSSETDKMNLDELLVWTRAAKISQRYIQEFLSAIEVEFKGESEDFRKSVKEQFINNVKKANLPNKIKAKLTSVAKKDLKFVLDWYCSELGMKLMRLQKGSEIQPTQKPAQVSNRRKKLYEEFISLPFFSKKDRAISSLLNQSLAKAILQVRDIPVEQKELRKCLRQHEQIIDRKEEIYEGIKISFQNLSDEDLERTIEFFKSPPALQFIDAVSEGISNAANELK